MCQIAAADAWAISSHFVPPIPSPAEGSGQIWGRGGGGFAVRERQIQLRKLRENCRTIAGKLWCRNQTSRSLGKQHFHTAGTQGTNKHAAWTNKKQLQESCGKLRKCAKNCKNCGPRPRPPLYGTTRVRDGWRPQVVLRVPLMITPASPTVPWDVWYASLP